MVVWLCILLMCAVSVHFNHRVRLHTVYRSKPCNVAARILVRQHIATRSFGVNNPWASSCDVNGIISPFENTCFFVLSCHNLATYFPYAVTITIQTDRRTDGQQDYPNSRSYCVAVRSAKNYTCEYIGEYMGMGRLGPQKE